MIDAKTISEVLADHVYNDWGDITSDDDGRDMYDTVDALDFSDAAEKINNALAEKQYFRLTKIQLLP